MDLTKFLHDVNIPKKKRFSPGSTSMDFSTMVEDKTTATADTKEPLMSMEEAATILLQLANSKVEFCNPFNEIEENKRRKRKKTNSEVKDKKGGTKKKTERKKTKKKKEKVLSPASDMPESMRNRITEMGGYQIQLVIQKVLKKTDLSKNHGRLSLPTQQLRLTNFLTDEEMAQLSAKDESGKLKKGMDVKIVDPMLREKTICLKKWKIGSDTVFCLMTQWNSFVQENSLQNDDNIQLWSFRVNRVDPTTETIKSELCFAMIKLEVANGVNEVANDVNA